MIFHFSYQIQSWLGLESAQVQDQGNTIKYVLDLWTSNNPRIKEQFIERNLIQDGIYYLMFIRNGKILRGDDYVNEDDEISVSILIHGG